MPSGDKTTAAALLGIGRTAAYELSPKGAMADPGSASWQFVRIPTGPLLDCFSSAGQANSSARGAQTSDYRLLWGFARAM